MMDIDLCAVSCRSSMPAASPRPASGFTVPSRRSASRSSGSRISSAPVAAAKRQAGNAHRGRRAFSPTRGDFRARAGGARGGGAANGRQRRAPWHPGRVRSLPAGRVAVGFRARGPTLRLDVSSGRSVAQKRALELGELDIALYKRNAGDGRAIAAWPERLQWVISREHPVDLKRNPIPLAVAEQGCLYRNRLIHAIEAAGRTWHIAYTVRTCRASRPPSRSGSA